MSSYQKEELVVLSRDTELNDGLKLLKGTIGMVLSLPNPKGIRRHTFTILFEDNSIFGGVIEVFGVPHSSFKRPA